MTPDAGGLVLAIDQTHAMGVAELLRRRHGVEPVVVVSDDADAQARLDSFAKGDAPWVVAVKMVSEGVDIPRLEVGVYATAVTTELFFRQAVGRVVRVRESGAGEDAAFFLPDDPRLRTFAARIAAQRNHTLSAEVDDLTGDDDGAGGSGTRGLFCPVSATAIDAGAIFDGAELTPAELARAEALKAASPQTVGLPTAAVAVLLRLAGGPVVAGPALLPAEEEAPFRRKRRLREANSRITRRIAYAHGRDHAEVNTALNVAVGRRSVKDMGVEDLERRLALAQRWLSENVEPS